MTTPNLPATQVTESVETQWGIPLQPAGCPNCKQVFLIGSSAMGIPCPDCGKGKLAPQPALLRPEPPELLIPFQKKPADLLPALTGFVKEVWLRPDDFNPNTLMHRMVPVYWPMWLVDSDVNGNWQAEAGFDYQVESAQESYSSSGWHSRDVIETRVRWEPRVGLIDRHYDNISSPATSDYQRKLNLVGNYQLEKSIPYQHDLVGQAALKAPDLQPESAWPLAQSTLNRLAGEDCRKACDGQHFRNFIVHASYDSLHWTQLLMPLFSTFYTDDDGNPHPVLINGQTGRIGGVRLASQKKGWQRAGISLAVAVGILLLALLCFALSVLLPPLSVVGILLAVAAFGVGIYAIVPAVWPWQWNRGQQVQKVITH